MVENSLNNNKARVAGGAGYALLGRLGAVIEAASFIAFTWLYGAETFGLFAVLWSYVKVTSAFSEMAMTTALQRYVPQSDTSEKSYIAGYALKLSLLLSLILALIFTVTAPYFTPFINTSSNDNLHLLNIMRIYIWVLPFWCLVNVSTAAVRATRTFGPEVKVRIFYEQGLRFTVGCLLALAGYLSYGLFIAHLISMMLAAFFALRLLAKYYDITAILKAPITGTTPSEIWRYGLSIMPAYLIKMLFSEFPVMFLNMLLPGAAGAAAGGYYAIARKVASSLQAIHKTFEYVVAPLTAEKTGMNDKTALAEIYTYATRLSVSITLPLAAALILARYDILAVMRPEFQVAGQAIAILCVGRVLEAVTGPSAAITEMLGHRLLPALNGFLGLVSMLVLGFIFIPEHGVTGAAIAAALGLNLTAYLSLIETKILFGLSPFNKELIRPVILSSLCAALILVLVPFSHHWQAPYGILTAIFLLMGSFALLIRYGFSLSDTNTFGKVGKALRNLKS